MNHTNFESDIMEQTPEKKLEAERKHIESVLHYMDEFPYSGQNREGAAIIRKFIANAQSTSAQGQGVAKKNLGCTGFEYRNFGGSHITILSNGGSSGGISIPSAPLVAVSDNANILPGYQEFHEYQNQQPIAGQVAPHAFKSSDIVDLARMMIEALPDANVGAIRETLIRWEDGIAAMPTTAEEAPQATVEPLTDAFISAAKLFAEAHIASDEMDAAEDIDLDATTDEEHQAADDLYNSTKKAMVEAYKISLATPPTSKATESQSDRGVDAIMAALRESANEKLLSFSAKEMRGVLNLWNSEKQQLAMYKKQFSSKADTGEAIHKELDEFGIHTTDANGDPLPLWQRVCKFAVLQMKFASEGSLEEAAKECELQMSEPECPERAQYCADAIRALKSTPPTIEALTVEQKIGTYRDGWNNAVLDIYTRCLSWAEARSAKRGGNALNNFAEEIYKQYAPLKSATPSTIKAEPTGEMSGMERAFSSKAITARDERKKD